MERASSTDPKRYSSGENMRSAPVRHVNGLMRSVGGKYQGKPLFLHALHGMQQHLLVSKIQSRGGFVQEQKRAFRSQGSSDEHELPFASAQFEKGAFFKRTHAELFQSLPGFGKIPFSRGGEKSHVPDAPHKHHIQNGVGKKGYRSVLGNVSYGTLQSQGSAFGEKRFPEGSAEGWSFHGHWGPRMARAFPRSREKE